MQMGIQVRNAFRQRDPHVPGQHQRTRYVVCFEKIFLGWLNVSTRAFFSPLLSCRERERVRKKKKVEMAPTDEENGGGRPGGKTTMGETRERERESGMMFLPLVWFRWRRVKMASGNYPVPVRSIRQAIRITRDVNSNLVTPFNFVANESSVGCFSSYTPYYDYGAFPDNLSTYRFFLPSLFFLQVQSHHHKRTDYVWILKFYRARSLYISFPIFNPIVGESY